MGDDEPGQDDNLEIEVGPLHPLSTVGPDGKATVGRPPFASGRPLRAQRRRGILVTVALLVTLVALTMTIAPTREALRGLVFGPTPTATKPVPAGEDNLYVTLSPHWGSVSLDNRVLTSLPVEGVDQPLHLTRGLHVLRWRFAPIMDYSCHLTVPTAIGDTCPTSIGILQGKKGIGVVVALQLSLTTLEPGYRASLLTAMQAALDAQQSSETVRQGELYLGAYNETNHDIEPVVATQPLRATLHVALDADNADVKCPAMQPGQGANCTMNGDCRELCTAPWQSPQDAPGVAFQAYIVAHLAWRYTTLSGEVAADNQPDIGAELGFLGYNEQPVSISIGWNGSTWYVDAHIGEITQNEVPDPVCASAWATIQFNDLVAPTPAGWQAVTSFYIPGAPVAAGCLLVLTAPGIGPVLLLHRFGVLLAANDAAQHSLGRVLPVADAYEQALAHQLAQKLPGIAGAGGNG
jgi:hypothetical protein